MPESDGTPSCEESDLADLAGEIMHAAPHNVVFQVRFLGESQLKLQSHFRRFIEKELGERGADREKYPLLQYFIDAHSAELRDFVFTGVSLECSVRIDDMERMTGESAGMLRVDLWDSLISHIGSAQRKFRNEAGDMHQQLQTLEAEIAAGRMDRQ